MRKPVILATVLAAVSLTACTEGNRYGHRDGYGPPPRDRDGYYLRDNDYVYRDNDGRYYCKRPDGTTGAIVGALAGGVLGNIIAPGGSRTLGTLLGAGGGALAGNAIDKNNVRCE